MCRPVPDLAHDRVGPARFAALATAALRECIGDAAVHDEPLILASCNGAAHRSSREDWLDAFDTRALLAGTPWARSSLPIASGSCASGFHALYLARALLDAGRATTAYVLAVDPLSPASHQNYETLRVLSPGPTAPWTGETDGFIPGEAAVALRVVATGAGTPVSGPALTLDHPGGDGLARLMSGVRSARTVLGQGTGPATVDAAELGSLATCTERAPLSTTGFHFGHTQGCSGLLSLALATLGEQPIASLALPHARAVDGTRLIDRPAPVIDAVVACRALGGSCAAAAVGRAEIADVAPVWVTPSPPDAIHIPFLRQIADQASRRRPTNPPRAVIAVLDAPLPPPPRGAIASRILPSAVREMTPGFVPQLISSVWGYCGPALCVVGGGDSALDLLPPWPDACIIRVRGRGDERVVEWRGAVIGSDPW